MTDRDECLRENGAVPQCCVDGPGQAAVRELQGRRMEAERQVRELSAATSLVCDEVVYVQGRDPALTKERQTVGMTRLDFDMLIENDLNAYLRGLRDEKEAEYANGADTLLNFHLAGPFLGLTPAQYAMVLLTKHVQGIAKQVMAGKWRWAYHTEDGGEGLKQRIADLKNYADLLFALLSEEAGA